MNRSVSKRREKVGKNTKAVVGLINALHTQRKFKRLCVYSLQALVKQVCPPNTTWQDSVEDCVGAKGIRVLTDLLERYGNDKQILTCVTKILSQMPKHHWRGKEFAKSLVNDGAVYDTLRAIAENNTLQDDALKNALDMIEKCAHVNARSMGTKDNIVAISAVQKSYANDPVVHESCARTYESICRSRAAASVFVENNMIEFTFDAMHMKGATQESILAELRTLNRLAVKKENIARIEKYDGLRKTVGILEQYPELANIQRLGGRLINSVAGEFVEKIMKDMMSASTSVKDKEYYAQLLASLALKSKSANKILLCGGVDNVMKLLKDSSITPKMSTSLMQILQRLATVNVDAVRQEIEHGGLETIMHMISINKNNPMVCATCINAFKTLAMDAATVKKLEESGAIKTAIDILLEHPDFKDAAIHGVEFIGKLVGLNYPVSKLIAMGGIKACLLAIRTSPDNPKVVENGLVALAKMAETGEKACSEIGKSGLSAAIDALRDFPENENISESSLNLLNALCGLAQNRVDFEELGGIEAVVGTLYKFKNNKAIQNVGSTILNSLLSQDLIKKTIQILETNAYMIPDQDKSTLKLIQGALMKLTVFASSGHAKPILSLGGLKAVIDTFEKFKGVYRNKNELNADGIVGCFRTMKEVCANRGEIEAQLRQQLISSNVIGSIVNFISNNPKDTRTVIEAVRLLNEISSFVNIDTIVDSDVIEAVLAPLRLTENAELCKECVDTLSTISKSQVGAKALVDRGATRQMLKTMADTSDKIAFEACHLEMLNAFDRVARFAKGAQALKKQKAIRIVVDNLNDHLGQSEFEDAGLRVLGALMDKDSAREQVENLVSLTKGKITSKKLKALTNSLNTVALISQLGNYTDIVIEAGGPAAFARALKALEAMQPSKNRTAAMRAAILGLSLVAKKVSPKLYKDAVKVVISALEEYPEAVLRTLESFAAHEENVDMILDSNALQKMFTLLETRGDEGAIADGVFKTISQLAKHNRGRKQIAAIEGIEQVMNWLKENADDADPAAMSSCLQFLSNMSLDPKLAKTIAEAGAVDLVLDILSDGNQSSATMASGINLLEHICVAMPDQCAAQIKSGLANRLLQMFVSSGTGRRGSAHEYSNDSQAAIAMMSYMAQLVKNEDLKAQLKDMGAADVLMGLMKLHSNSPELMNIGKSTLGTMLSPKELLQRALHDARRIDAEIAGGAVNVRNLSRLQGAFDDVLNSLRMTKDLSKHEGQDVLRTLQNTTKNMKDIETKFPTFQTQTRKIMYSGFEIIGALDELNLGLKLIQVVPPLIVELANCEQSQDADGALLITKTLHKMSADPQVLDILVDGNAGTLLLKLNDMAGSLRAEPLKLAVQDLMKDLATHILDPKRDYVTKKSHFKPTIQALELLGACVNTGLSGVVAQIAKMPGGKATLAHLLKMQLDQNDNASDEERARLAQAKIHIVELIHDMVKNGETVDPQLLDAFVTSLSGFVPGSLDQLNSKELRDLQFQVYNMQLNCLSDLAQTAQGTKLMLKNPKMVEMIMTLMAMDNSKIATRAVELLAKMAEHGKDPEIMNLLLKEKIVEFAIAMQGTEALKKSPEFAAATLTLIQGLVKMGGTDALVKAGFTKDHMNAIEEWGATFKKNEVIRAHLIPGSESETMKLLKKKFPNSISDQLATFFGRMDNDIDDVYSLRMAQDEETKQVYYINKDNTTTWKRPPELDEFITVLKKGASKMKNYKGNANEQDAKLIKRSVDVLNNLVKDIDLVKNIVQALNHMAENDGNLKKLAENGGIEAIIRVLREHPDDDELLRTLLLLIEKFCSNTVFKERIGKVGAVEVLVIAAEKQAYGDGPLPFGYRRCYDHNKRRHYYYNKDEGKSVWKRPPPPKEFKSIWREAKDKNGRVYYFNKETKKTSWVLPEDELKKRQDINARLDRTPHHLLAAQVLNVLVKLTFRSKQNTTLANETFPGVKSIRKMLEVFKRSPRISEIAFTLTTNWGATGKYRVNLRDELAELIMEYIRNLHYDDAMFKAALRALGNISLVYDNVKYLVDKGAVKVISKWVKKSGDSVKETAIRVFCIFAQAYARKKQEDGHDEHDEISVCQKIIEDKGASCILEIAKDYIDLSPSMMKASVEALNAIASDSAAAHMLVQTNMMDLIVRVMKAMDYDIQVLEPCFELLYTMCKSSNAMDKLVEVQGVPVILTTLEANDASSKYILTYGIRLVNLLSSTKNEKHRPVVVNTDAIETLVRLLEDHTEEPKVCMEILRALSNLAAPPEDSSHLDLSHNVADLSMHAVVNVINQNSRNAKVVNAALQLVGFLSFDAKNVQMIVRMGGIGMIMNAISLHPDNEMIIERCVKNLDFIAISDKDNALVVVEHEGIRLIKAIKENYVDNKEILDICDSALLSFASVDGVAPSPGVLTPSEDSPTKEEKKDEALPDVNWDEFD